MPEKEMMTDIGRLFSQMYKTIQAYHIENEVLKEMLLSKGLTKQKLQKAMQAAKRAHGRKNYSLPIPKFYERMLKLLGECENRKQFESCLPKGMIQ
jgi:hypothetical protein